MLAMDTDFPEEEIVENPTLKAAYNLAPLHQNQPLRWDHKVDLLGEKIYDKIIHLCEICELPVLIYGRMLPCKHVFCFDCARRCEKTCKRCGLRVQKVEKSALGTVFVCSHGAPKHDPMGCRRTYLSQRDLQSHMVHRHVPKTTSESKVTQSPSSSSVQMPLTQQQAAQIDHQLSVSQASTVQPHLTRQLQISGSHGTSSHSSVHMSVSQQHSPGVAHGGGVLSVNTSMSQGNITKHKVPVSQSPVGPISQVPYGNPSVSTSEHSIYRPLDIVSVPQQKHQLQPHQLQHQPLPHQMQQQQPLPHQLQQQPPHQPLHHQQPPPHLPQQHQQIHQPQQHQVNVHSQGQSSMPQGQGMSQANLPHGHGMPQGPGIPQPHGSQGQDRPFGHNMPYGQNIPPGHTMDQSHSIPDGRNMQQGVNRDFGTRGEGHNLPPGHNVQDRGFGPNMQQGPDSDFRQNRQNPSQGVNRDFGSNIPQGRDFAQNVPQGGNFAPGQNRDFPGSNIPPGPGRDFGLNMPQDRDQDFRSNRDHDGRNLPQGGMNMPPGRNMPHDVDRRNMSQGFDREPGQGMPYDRDLRHNVSQGHDIQRHGHQGIDSQGGHNMPPGHNLPPGGRQMGPNTMHQGAQPFSNNNQSNVSSAMVPPMNNQPLPSHAPHMAGGTGQQNLPNKPLDNFNNNPQPTGPGGQGSQQRNANLISVPIQDEGQFRPLPFVNTSHGGGGQFAQSNAKMQHPPENLPQSSGPRYNNPQQMGGNQPGGNNNQNPNFNPGLNNQGAMRNPGPGMPPGLANIVNAINMGSRLPPPGQMGSPRFNPGNRWPNPRGMPPRMMRPRGDGHFNPGRPFKR